MICRSAGAIENYILLSYKYYAPLELLVMKMNYSILCRLFAIALEMTYSQSLSSYECDPSFLRMTRLRIAAMSKKIREYPCFREANPCHPRAK
jgi:hypothetical protein